MKKVQLTIAAMLLTASISILNAQSMDNTVKVGGEAMYPKKKDKIINGKYFKYDFVSITFSLFLFSNSSIKGS